jgi:hypothetical protein
LLDSVDAQIRNCSESDIVRLAWPRAVRAPAGVLFLVQVKIAVSRGAKSAGRKSRLTHKKAGLNTSCRWCATSRILANSDFTAKTIPSGPADQCPIARIQTKLLHPMFLYARHVFMKQMESGKADGQLPDCPHRWPRRESEPGAQTASCVPVVCLR